MARARDEDEFTPEPDSGSSGYLHTSYVNTSEVEESDEWEQKLLKLREKAIEMTKPPDMRELNQPFMEWFNTMLEAEKARSSAKSNPLLVLQGGTWKGQGTGLAPINAMEEHLRKRLADIANQNAQRLILFLGWRTAVASAALHFAKEAAKALARRWRRRRVLAAVNFTCDVLLPTSYWGPGLGITFGVNELLAGSAWGATTTTLGAIGSSLRGGGATASKPPPQPRSTPLHLLHLSTD